MTNYGSKWSEDEVTLALYLYCQIPFGRCTHRDRDVQELARLLDRTPSAVALKLGNLGRLDPTLKARGVSGLSHGAAIDRRVWEQYRNDWEALVERSRAILAGRGAELQTGPERDLRPLALPKGPTQTESAVKTRLKQGFFRRAVLSSYDHACCVCRLQVPQLLVASHIIPWSKREDTRVDPANGLAMCVIHDRAYDVGLMTVSPDHRIRVSAHLRESSHTIVRTVFGAYEGREIVLPRRFVPRSDCLNWHLEHVYQG